ncbi:hypothetical protein NE237_025773 [Protea cynaroides]|uniref:Uncharacterized protein n=1 Tax=Protea cynaroides TaxID=273540 RepID=A0A9Q0H6V8_9MAGN|nr:hypothetical protein NE237_025773 [Protea cynaroides]
MVERNHDSLVPIRTVTSSPGGSAVLGDNGRVEVVFEDVLAMDEILKEAGGFSIVVGKRPVGWPPGRGQKKTEQVTSNDESAPSCPSGVPSKKGFPMKVIFWNMRGVSNPKNETVVEETLKTHGPNIMGIAEPMVSPLKAPKLMLDR